MSEQNNETTWLKIEDHLRAALSGDRQKDALDYLAYLKATGISITSKFSPEPLVIGDAPDGKFHSYEFGTDNGLVCFLVIQPCEFGWTIDIASHSGHQNFPADEKVKAFAWEHARICQHFITNGKECGCGNQPGSRIILFGKEINNSCNGNVEINNPHGETLELAKRLADVWK